jgi:hypothetical protein
MHFYLAVQGITQQTLFAVVDGNPGFVTGSFNTEYAHALINPVKCQHPVNVC